MCDNPLQNQKLFNLDNVMKEVLSLFVLNKETEAQRQSLADLRKSVSGRASL